jgi:hypothetical protein
MTECFLRLPIQGILTKTAGTNDGVEQPTQWREPWLILAQQVRRPGAHRRTPLELRRRVRR